MKAQLILALTLLPLVGLLALGVASSAAARTIGLDEAARIALERVPGKVESIDLEFHRGTEVYEVEVRDTEDQEHELVIDAESGEILRESIDD